MAVTTSKRVSYEEGSLDQYLREVSLHELLTANRANVTTPGRGVSVPS